MFFFCFSHQKRCFKIKKKATVQSPNVKIASSLFTWLTYSCGSCGGWLLIHSRALWIASGIGGGVGKWSPFFRKKTDEKIQLNIQTEQEKVGNFTKIICWLIIIEKLINIDRTDRFTYLWLESVLVSDIG